MNRDKQRELVKKIGIALVALLVIYWVVHHFFGKKPINIPTPVVAVKQPEWRDMALYVTQTGTTVAYNSVNLVARIEGYLDAIKFKDGSFVKKGDLLFIVQPEPYMEQLKAAQATVAAQKAALQYSQSEYARQQRMFKENASSQNNLEKWLAKTHESQAEVDKAVANEEIAAINYSYTHILAPFDGRIGRHLVDIGNLVGKGAATTLATIEQIHPIYIYFNLNELDLIKLRNAARSEGLKPKDLNKISAYINMQNESGFQHVAKLDFVNTSLNAATGTMEFRAVLENKDYKFVPGLYVQVQVAITRPKKELTVPDVAVLYDQIGPYLLSVDNNNIVVLKRVTLGTVEKGMRAITKGLTEKDRVIVNGLQNATPGNKVTPTTQTASYF